MEDKIRILFTGSWDRMIDNLMERMTYTHQMMRCHLLETDFEKALQHFSPEAVIVCLSEEPREIAKVQATVENSLQNTGIPLFAIGHDEDCQRLRQKLLVPNIEIFARPLDTAGLLEMLVQRAEKYRQTHAAAPKTQATPAGQAPVASQGFYGQGVTDNEGGYDDGMTPENRAAEKKLIQHIEKINNMKGRMSVLVVDDDVLMLNTIKLYLQDLYDVTVVPSGKLAVKFLAKKHADMVLLDYMMPEMDGPQVLRLIREQSPCPNIPVLFLTGVSDKESVLRGLEFRPNGYLLKPITRINLLERVTEILLGI